MSFTHNNVALPKACTTRTMTNGKALAVDKITIMALSLCVRLFFHPNIHMNGSRRVWYVCGDDFGEESEENDEWSLESETYDMATWHWFIQI